MSKFIYMAGLLDGEGTIGLTKNNSNRFRTPYVSVTSTTPEIINWLKENFNGVVCSQKTYKEHHKTSWSWRLRNLTHVFELLELVTPHMLEPKKIARANLILSEYKSVTPRNGKYTANMLEGKERFEKTFFAL